MAGYFSSDEREFALFRSPSAPSWRRPQSAALGAVLAQWSLGGEAPLVAVPTGVGKTAIALASPYLAGADRVLVVVPTTELRRQSADQFATQQVLKSIGALADDASPPSVVEVQGRVIDWDALRAADVVIGIPSSISPVHFEDDGPAPDFFDLVIIDEAHHAPAKTWNAILEFFSTGRSLLLTATPHRRDGKRLPGKLVYYYPLRQALDEGLYQPVQPLVVAAPAGATRNDMDVLIRDNVLDILRQPEHSQSQLIVRAATRKRATELATLYSEEGLEIPVLHSGLGSARQRSVIDGLRSGGHRGVAMVGMLVEGFDLPSLRVAAYHDKHKSLEPTTQLIGRLARVSDQYSQPSRLVTVRDIDTYPHLEGAVRALYEEDNDWATVLPGIIDEYVEGELANQEYARSFDPAPTVVDLASIHPLRRVTIFEIHSRDPWFPTYSDGAVPDELAPAAMFAGQSVLYSGTNPTHTTLLVVTATIVRPRWNDGDGLDAPIYDLHIVSYQPSGRTDQPDLLLVNSGRPVGQKGLIEVAGAAEVARAANAERVQAAFDSLERTGVSSVGVRNTYGTTRGTPSYRMFAGSSIEGGLRDSDTAQASLGHAMVQVTGEAGSFTAGVSTGKSKYWETRYTPLRLYEDFIQDMAARYWSPTASASGPLLPQITRGRSFSSWPDEAVVAVESDYQLLGSQWALPDGTPLDSFDLVAGIEAVDVGAPEVDEVGQLPIAALTPGTPALLRWTGTLSVDGHVVPTSDELTVQRGFSNPRAFSELIEERPPTIFFLNGSTVRGREYFPPTSNAPHLPDGLLRPYDWDGVDITSETAAKAAEKRLGISVHEWLEAHLMSQPKRGRHRWILSNDGPGELADYLVIESLGSSGIAIDLWHAKFAGGSVPSVRVGDFEVVTAQAIKSRRWPTDLSFWERLAARLAGDEHPALRVIEGRRRPLEVLLGRHERWGRMALTTRRPRPTARIGIVQPGLSVSGLSADLAGGANSAHQIVQLLTVYRDAVLNIATPLVLAAP